ncbi:MAG TPA: septal ring lytic transglycosylase RlpA family protein [Burkholderiaceae bacterium]
MMETATRRAAPWLSIAAALAVLAGCAAGPRGASGPGGTNLPSGAWPSRDGPEPNPPPNLERVPDAQPQVEPFREGGPNKPYDVLGRSYVPITRDAPFTERGLASWYGRFFHGKRTASGEVYNMYAMTAAHPTLPIPSYARVRNPANGREVIVRINDRGPFHTGRIIDLSYTAAVRLDLRGVGQVEVQRITFEDIRTGAWRRDGSGAGAGDVAVAAAAPPAPPPAPAAAPTVMIVAAPVVAAPAEVGPVPASAPAADAAVASVATVAGVAEPVAAVPPPVADAPSARAYTAAARGFWIQLGAFRQREGAEGFQQQVEAELDWLSPLLAVFSDAALYRLQAGPYPSRVDARAAAERIRDGLKLVPVIVERR